MSENTEGQVNVLVPLADGWEEIETVSIIDLLRREKAKVTVASIMGKNNGLTVTSQQNMKFEADAHFEDIENENFDLIVSSGGLKNATLQGSYKPLIEKYRAQRDSGKLFGAICASPKKIFDENKLID